MAAKGWTVAALVAALSVAGCGGDPDETASAGTEGAAPASPGEDGGSGVPAVDVVPRPEQTIAAGRLSPVNNSGVTGSVTVRGIGERTEVAMNVTGTAPGTTQVLASVVRGTCEASGAEVVALAPLPVGAGQIAARTDTLDLPPGAVLDGGHALVVRAPEAGPAVPPLACSPLPRWERRPPVG
jgi:hypothetical protein